MNFQLSFKVNDHLFLKDPESSEVGKQIITEAISLIHELGIEHFTFKKLATRMGTTEATIYRYFENKQKILLYILNWYWYYLDFLITFSLQNLQSPVEKLEIVLKILTQQLDNKSSSKDYNKEHLNDIVIRESTKVYLIKEVKELNKEEFFAPYKEICAVIAKVITECNPKYLYPKSLSSTLIETSHTQQFFAEYLPRLTDVKERGQKEYTYQYLKDLVAKILF